MDALVKEIKQLIEVSKEKQKAILERDISLMQSIGEKESRLAKSVHTGISTIGSETLKSNFFLGLYTELNNVHEQNVTLLEDYRVISDHYFHALKREDENTYNVDGKQSVSSSRFYSVHA